MDAFDRQSSRPDSTSNSQEQPRLHRTPSQPTLPSFRDIIPAHLHIAIEETPQEPASERPSSESTLASVVQMPSMTRSIAPSPVESLSGPIPSFAESFEDPSLRNVQHSYPAELSTRRQSEPMPTWGHPSQYPDASSVYNAPQSSLYPNQSYSTFRPSPNLPPIRDMHPRSDRMQGVTDPTFQVPVSPYTSGYGHPGTSQPSLDSGSFPPRRTPYYDAAPRNHLTYPTVSRQHGVGGMDYTRYQQPYDPYRVPQQYHGTYSEPQYSPGMHNGSQSANFGVTGDSADSRAKRRRGNLPKPVTDILRAWFHEHLDHPYPTEEDKQLFIARTGLTISQISNWFINARRRQLPSLRQNRERANQVQSRDQPDRFRSQESSLSPR